MTGDGRSFRDAMEAALYDERTGYYGAGRVRFGRRGDFTTSSGVSALFGACLARWADDVRRSIGSPGEFAVVELGPGDGLLAADILRVFEGPYVCVERSAALAARQRERLERFGDRVRWASLDELARSPVTGVVVANEVFDALPVYRVRGVAGALEEQFVGGGDAWRPVGSAAVRAYVERYAPWLFDRERPVVVDVCLDALELVDSLAAAVALGSVVVIDYGDEAAELYGAHRPQGTVRAIRDHVQVDDVLADPGAQDITASVNFTAIADRARERGFAVSELVSQSAFLARWGVVELAARPSASIEERAAAKALLVPTGYGSVFRVLELERTQSRSR